MNNQGCIGDDFYFLVKCNVLNDLRKRYLSSYYCKNPSIIKMNKLFNKHYKVVWINTCQYLKQCFQRMALPINVHVYI